MRMGQTENCLPHFCGESYSRNGDNMTGTYCFADVIVRIDSIYDKIHLFCAGYSTEGEPEIHIVVYPQDIERERRLFEYAAEADGREAERFLPEEYEITAVYRKIASELPNFNAFLMHGSVVSVDGFAYMFTARAGTGKSTHSRLWREVLGDRAVMVNDDKPLIRIREDGSAIAYGTPWCGKHRLGNRISVPLRAICILQRSTGNHIVKISKSEAYPMLLQQIFRPDDVAGLQKTVQLIDRMNVDFWRLGCNMEPEAAKVSYAAMSGDAGVV